MIAKQNTLSLYVHWPFCESKCPYCDFNSHVRENIDASRYETALLSELDFFAGKTQGKTLSSIFFGGGTPSLMPPTTTAAVINKAKATWDHDADLEITLEANPGSSEAKKFREFRKAGVNRLSLGVQSFRDEALKFLGRVHNAGEALGAIELARDTFPRFSFDLMYALPGQTLAQWEEELGQGLDLAAGHISLYQLTLEKDTAFYRQHKRGLLHLPPEGIAADLYTLTNKMCAKAGLPAYETSNYATPGFESRHNLNYWQGGAYAGIGPGAHSRIFSNRSWQAMATHKKPEDWLAAVEEGGNAVREAVPVSRPERGEEVIMTALRLSGGLSKTAFKGISGKPLNDFINPGALEFLIAEKLLVETQSHLAATPKGALLLDSILGELLG